MGASNSSIMHDYHSLECWAVGVSPTRVQIFRRIPAFANQAPVRDWSIAIYNFDDQDFAHVNEPKQEEWLRLCAMAAKEQDPEKLYELVQQINLLLEERERKLKKTREPA
jgi:hypothetical protein